MSDGIECASICVELGLAGINWAEGLCASVVCVIGLNKSSWPVFRVGDGIPMQLYGLVFGMGDGFLIELSQPMVAIGDGYPIESGGPVRDGNLIGSSWLMFRSDDDTLVESSRPMVGVDDGDLIGSSQLSFGVGDDNTI